MNLEVTFRHMDHTESIDSKIREKLAHFAEKHFSKNAIIKWTCLVEHNEHLAQVHITDKGMEFHAKAGSPNMYKTIDEAIKKLESQVSSKKHLH
jgi:ribosomal subunit interface protein